MPLDAITIAGSRDVTSSLDCCTDVIVTMRVV